MIMSTDVSYPNENSCSWFLLKAIESTPHTLDKLCEMYPAMLRISIRGRLSELKSQDLIEKTGKIWRRKKK